MSVVVTKKNVELYQVRHQQGGSWCDISLSCGDGTVNVMINSDYGSFGHYWGGCGESAKAFLTRISFSYTMDKLLGTRSLYVLNEEKNLRDIRILILKARRNKRLDEDEARDAWTDMESICYQSTEDTYINNIAAHDSYRVLFEYYENVPCHTTVNPIYVTFWERCWMPFVEQLKTELA